MNRRRLRTAAALALQGLALAALAAALLGAAWLDPRSRPRVLLLVDRSHSVPRPEADLAVADARHALKAAGAGEVLQIDFAAHPGPPRSALGAPDPALDPQATDLEAALQAALAAHAQAPLQGLAVLSDGLANAGDSLRGLRAVREAGLPLQWIAVGRPPPPAQLAQVLAPRQARAGEPIRLDLRLAGPAALGRDPPWRVEATTRGETGATRHAHAAVDAEGRATIDIDAPGRGAVVVDLLLRDPASGDAVDALPDAAAVDVRPRASLLHVRGSAGPLARSLQDGGWSLDTVPAGQLDAFSDGLDRYAAVLLDDVAVGDAGGRFWQALADAVRLRGLGLMVLGGERSFALGGYRDSVLESVLPVLALPAALDQPASVVFALDKSGSMGQGTGGVDRFDLARQAVLESVRRLSARDATGLVLFDTEPRLLLPLMPAPDAGPALAGDWRARPNGGTRLLPAIEAAAGELARAGSGRRLLVVVTDGFVDDPDLPRLRERLARERIEALALAIGPDANVAALRRLLGDGASVLRVDQVAELPRLMASGLERRRARVERGRIEAVQQQPLPFADGTLAPWPPVAAHAVTQAAPDAVVAVATRSGEPLIALREAGRGRVVAVTSGLGAWTPAWLDWPAWPRLAGGLASWVSGQRPGDTLAARDGADGFTIDLELAAGAEAPHEERVSVTVDTPRAQGLPVAAEPVAAGRLQAQIDDAGPGLYTVVVSTPRGTQRLLHLRRPRLEQRSWGLNPALADWRREGLAGDWDPAALLRAGAGAPPDRPPDRSLIVAALLLFVAGLLVDRASLPPGLLRAATRRWRSRAGARQA